MNNTTIINIFNSGDTNITYNKAQHGQIMATIVYKILKFEPMIKKSMVENHALFAIVTFSKINSFAYINSIVIQHL